MVLTKTRGKEIETGSARRKKFLANERKGFAHCWQYQDRAIPFSWVGIAHIFLSYIFLLAKPDRKM
jgi:hypothetical protein